MKQWIKQALKVIIGAVSGFFAAVFFVFYVEKKQQEKQSKKTPQQIKNEKEAEIEKTSPDILIANSGNVPEHNSRIEEHKEEFRKRVKERFSKTASNN